MKPSSFTVWCLRNHVDRKAISFSGVRVVPNGDGTAKIRMIRRTSDGETYVNTVIVTTGYMKVRDWRKTLADALWRCRRILHRRMYDWDFNEPQD